MNEYEDRIVLNYDQIESPRFVDIVDECRGLILRKGTYDVISRSFTRFYNLSEGIDIAKSGPREVGYFRKASSYYRPVQTLGNIDIKTALIQSKIDGSLISVGFDGVNWCFSTRKMAFGEGESNFGKTFKQLFESVVEYKTIMQFLNSNAEVKLFTWIFELATPENRVVTPFTEYHAILIGARDLRDGNELTSDYLDIDAKLMGVQRPEQYKVNSYEELIAFVNAKPWMDEGVVIVQENVGSHDRIKCKNLNYLAIAHLRENGKMSPKSILRIVMSNEQEEYLQYYKEDRKFFEFVKDIYDTMIKNIETIYEKYKGITVQKDFALSILSETKNGVESGALFAMRKGTKLNKYFEDYGHKKLSKGLNLKAKFAEFFKVQVEDDEEA